MNPLEGRIALAAVFLKDFLAKQPEQQSLDCQNLHFTIDILNEVLLAARK